jgi:hypothetical protein
VDVELFDSTGQTVMLDGIAATLGARPREAAAAPA